MRTRLLGTIAIAALALTACGGDDDGGGGGGGGPQDQVADMLIDTFNEAAEVEGVEGIEIDEGCIRDRVGDLSDDDARAIVAAGPDGNPETSAEAEAIGASVIDCIDMSASGLGELDSDG